MSFSALRDLGRSPVLRMAAPLVVSFVLRGAFTFVDTAYAAILGDEAVAAIGLTVPLEFLMISIWVGLSTGLTSSLSRAMGAEQGERMEQYLRCTRRLVLLVAPAFLLVGVGVWFVAPRMGLEPAVASAFQVYGSVLIGGSALTAFWSVLPDSIVKAHHDTRSTMWAGIISSVLNVALNTFFLFVLHWGVFGIALSTVLGRIGGLVYALGRARHHERRREREQETPRPGLDDHPYRSILVLAVPASATFGLMALETALVNALLAGTAHPTESIAAYSIYYRVFLFLLNPVIATAVALLPYAARSFGTRQVSAVRRGLRETGRATLLYVGLLVAPALLAAGPWLADVLAESPITARYATFALRLVPVAVLTASPFLLCRPVFEGMGRGTPGLLMAVLRYLLLAAPAAWLGLEAARRAAAPGLYGLVVGLVVVSMLTSTLFALWLHRALRDLDEDFPPPEEGDGVPTPAASEAMKEGREA